MQNIQGMLPSSLATANMMGSPNTTTSFHPRCRQRSITEGAGSYLPQCCCLNPYKYLLLVRVWEQSNCKLSKSSYSYLTVHSTSCWQCLGISILLRLREVVTFPPYYKLFHFWKRWLHEVLLGPIFWSLPKEQPGHHPRNRLQLLPLEWRLSSDQHSPALEL